VGRVRDEIHTGGSQENINTWPQSGGGNFVDITLRVVVEQATGTLMAFCPKFRHGTTRLCGAHNRIVAITFSSHILKAYETAMRAGGCKLVSGAGAGEGSSLS
jgi:hypothetical protein